MVRPLKGITSRPLPPKTSCRQGQETANGKVLARSRRKEKMCCLQAVALTLFNLAKKEEINIYPQKEENLSTTQISCISDDFTVIIKVICGSNSC